VRIDCIEFMPAGDFNKVLKWAEDRGLPKPWLMQVHPDNYPVDRVETRVVFEMPNGRSEFIRSEDWIGLTPGREVHGIDWLDIEKNYPLTGNAP
jgi:hypothetical protein